MSDETVILYCALTMAAIKLPPLHGSVFETQSGRMEPVPVDDPAAAVFIQIKSRRKEGICMSKLAVIYWSGTGNTKTMSNAFEDGARGKGAVVDLLTCADVGDVSVYDAVALAE